MSSVFHFDNRKVGYRKKRGGTKKKWPRDRGGKSMPPMVLSRSHFDRRKPAPLEMASGMTPHDKGENEVIRMGTR